jgi:aminopeptidase N
MGGIWLNEDFTTYCEALYWESIRGFDDFCYKVIKTADEYLEETRTRYERPLVTESYKHPDDLFDAHSYKKGSCILHMLRRDMGDNDFKKMLYVYLNIYMNQSVQTTSFLNIVEDISGKSLYRFLNQWIYGSGHPRLDIEFYLEHDMNKKKIRTTISQIFQQGETPEWNDGGSKKNHGFGINPGFIRSV